MSIRFKFRSCMNFDSVDIDGQPSISLWELRLKIARQKKLNIGVDIDLIFFDALSEQEYNDENLQIASGSSVIVKRVPAGTMPSTVKCQYQKLDSRGLNQRGTNHSKIPTKLPEPKTPDAWTSLHKVIRSNFPNNVLVELKCSLCNTFFKDAVMIPCCQHSFCDKCIRMALLEKAKCPKCSSSRFRVEDLLPNLSLRQAIAHLESQMVESEKALRRHVPDGESGIQGKDFSCAVIVVQWEPEKEMPQSPSASGKGSNLVMAESLSRTRSIDGGQGQYANHWDFPENCEGDRKPLNLLHSHVQEEGGNMKFLPTGTVEKVRLNFCQHAYYRFMVTPDMQPGKLPLCQGYIQAKYLYMDRNCYVCGTPDHLIRDCPLASNPNPMLQTGNDMLYPSPYWNNNTYSTLRPPLENMYANAGNAPFNASMVPPTPYVHPYMQSMHAGMPLHGGIMRMGGMALPAGNRDELPLNQYEYMGLQLAEDKRRIQNEKMGRSNDGFPSSSDRHRRESHLHHSRDSRKRGSHHNHLPSSALEPTSPVHQAPRSKERRGFGHDAKQSRHHARNSTDEVRDYKKWTSSGSYEDCRDGYHHKRKRVH